MSYLFMRLCELRDEYFNELDPADLSAIFSNLDSEGEYTSDELIGYLKGYSDLFNKRGL